MKKLFALINPRGKTREQLKRELKDAFQRHIRVEESSIVDMAQQAKRSPKKKEK